MNVAWYGCGVDTGLTADKLEKWLWPVMIALQGVGFRVHALVSDGHEVNRSLYKNIVEAAKEMGDTR